MRKSMILLIPMLFAGLLLLSHCKQEPQAERPQLAQDNDPGEPTTEKRDIDLDPRYEQIETIIAKSDCEGPRGAYTSEVHSARDGYAYLHQEFSYRDEDFEAVLENRNKGFLLNHSTKSVDSLSKPARAIVHGQEFHKMMLFPIGSFSDLRFAGEKRFDDGKYEEYSCNDLLNYPGKLYYDRARKVIKGIWTLDPGDAAQQVQMIATNWRESEYGLLPDQATVILSGRDTLSFNFTEILINSPDFTKRSF